MTHVLPSVPVMVALSQIVSYASGMVFSYLLNNFWVFRGKRQPTGAVPGFIVSQLGLMMVSAASIATASHFVKARPEFIWVAVMAVITVANFIILRKWVFKSS